MIQNELTPLESNPPKKSTEKKRAKEAPPTPEVRSRPHIGKATDDTTSEKSDASKKDGLSTRSQSPAKKDVKSKREYKEEKVEQKEEVKEVKEEVK